MNFPDSAFWGHMLATIGIEAGCLVALGFATQRFMRHAIWQRALWRGTIACLLLLVISEWTGIGRGAAGFFLGQKPMTRNFSISPQPMVAAVFAERLPVSKLNLPSSKAPPSIWWPGWVWLGGTVVVLLRIAAAQVFLLTLRLRRAKIADEVLYQRLKCVARCVRLQRRVTLLRMPRAISPMAFGIFRPTLGLPPDFESKLSVAEQEAVLAHELAHLAAKDPLWFLLADVTTALLWWHPFVWWARRSLQGASELAADEASAMLPDGPGALATCLVSLGKEMSASGAWGWIGINGGFQSKLGKRVDRLVQMSSSTKLTFSGRLGTAGRIVAGFLVIPASVLFFGAFQSAHAQKQENLPTQLQESWHSSPAAQMWTAFSESNPVPQPAATATNNADTATIAPSGASIKMSQISTNVTNAIVGAKHLYAIGKYNEAKSILDQVLKNNPDNKSPQYYLDLIRETRFSATNQTSPEYIVFPADPGVFPLSPDTLLTKIFRVNPNVFRKRLERLYNFSSGIYETRPQPAADPSLHFLFLGVAKRSTPDLHAMASNYFADAGVDLTPPKDVSFNERSGVIQVRGTEADLKIVQQAIEGLNSSPARVVIEAKFVELSQEEVKGLGSSGSLIAGTAALTPSPAVSNVVAVSLAMDTNIPIASSAMVSVLTPTEFGTLIAAIEKRTSADILTTPQVKTESGRQAHIEVGDGRNGVRLDVFPEVGADGFSIAMAASTAIQSDKITWQASAQQNLWEGQTLVISDETTNQTAGNKKRTLVFVTPRIIDSVGNFVHTEDEIAQKSGYYAIAPMSR